MSNCSSAMRSAPQAPTSERADAPCWKTAKCRAGVAIFSDITKYKQAEVDLERTIRDLRQPGATRRHRLSKASATAS